MPHVFDHSEAARRAQDGGRAGRAWRWFSARTIQAAERHRDVPWSRLASRLAVAAGLIAVSRIDPSFGLSPWLLVAGVIWLAVTLRACALKALDAASAASRR
jgi:hypothetical protein